MRFGFNSLHFTMNIDTAGLLDSAAFIPSPNCDERPEGTMISLLVIHYISLPPDQFSGGDVIRLFTNRLDFDSHPTYESLKGVKVSTHFFIRRDGTLIQFVPCGKRAWHAGVSNWQGRERCNNFSIGIELEGNGTVPFTDTQYAALIELTQCLRAHYPIEHIAGHSDIAPGRKTDPGPCFDWQRYAINVNCGDLFRAAGHAAVDHEKP